MNITMVYQCESSDIQMSVIFKTLYLEILFPLVSLTSSPFYMSGGKKMKDLHNNTANLSRLIYPLKYKIQETFQNPY